jgi:hypothetical protein
MERREVWNTNAKAVQRSTVIPLASSSIAGNTLLIGESLPSMFYPNTSKFSCLKQPPFSPIFLQPVPVFQKIAVSGPVFSVAEAYPCPKVKTQVPAQYRPPPISLAVKAARVRLLSVPGYTTTLFHQRMLPKSDQVFT